MIHGRRLRCIVRQCVRVVHDLLHVAKLVLQVVQLCVSELQRGGGLLTDQTCIAAEVRTGALQHETAVIVRRKGASGLRREHTAENTARERSDL